ncbi:MAG: 50S ribosomal protein L4 [archaeon]|jgi:large subunit ribosomal protein L4e
MKANIIGIDGTSKGNIELPAVFETEYKPKLIKRAVQSMQTKQKQAKGADPRAGLKTTALYQGMRGKPTPWRTINTDKARLPRTKNRRYLLYGRVGRVAQSVGGRSPNAPLSWKIIIEKINKKEKKLALASAIAATTDKLLVGKRFIVEKELPIVIDDAFEGQNKTKSIVEILAKIGAGKDLENAKDKTRKRAGKGKARGRTKKQKKSILIVTGSNKPVLKASRNLPGVDSVTVNSLNIELLAPGTEAGRLVVWTTSAIKALAEKNSAKKKVVKTVNVKKEKRATLLAKKKVTKISKKIIKKKAVKKNVEEDE